MSFLCVKDTSIIRPTWRCTFDISIPEHSWVAIVGPSGAGKTTLLETIAGFVEADRGSIAIDGKDVTSLPPAQRGIAYMFQNDALFQHLTVGKNLLLALHDDPSTSEKRLIKVKEAIAGVDLPAAYALRHPSSLSGGETMRANLARALLRGAPVLLLDEPFAALDRQLRHDMLQMVQRLHKERRMTTLCVTHHLEDALYAADLLVVVLNGHVEAFGPPEKLTRNPPTRAAADFFKTGTCLDLDSKTYFLTAADLVASPAAPTRFRAPHKLALPNAKAVRMGSHQMIEDPDSKMTMSLSANEDFGGVLWFDRQTVWTIPE